MPAATGRGRRVVSEAGGVSEARGPSRTRLIAARVLTVVAILLALVGMLAFYVAAHCPRRCWLRGGLAQDDRERRDPNASCEHRGRPAVCECRRRGGYRRATASRTERVGPRSRGCPALRHRSGGGNRPRAAAGTDGVGGVDDPDAAPSRAALGRQEPVHPDRWRQGRARPSSDHHPTRRPDSGNPTGGRQAASTAGRITIIDESQLQTAQTITKILRSVANWMWLVALAVAALAIWLARGRRRIELRALAIGVLLVGLLMLAAAPLRGRLSRRSTRQGRQRQAGGTDAWSILTQVLVDRAWVWIILGVVTLVGVWFVGETRSRRTGAPRRSAHPRGPPDDLWHRCGGPARDRARRTGRGSRLVERARSARPRHRRRRGRPKHRSTRSAPATLI